MTDTEVIIFMAIYGLVCLVLGFALGFVFSPNHKIKKLISEIQEILKAD